MAEKQKNFVEIAKFMRCEQKSLFRPENGFEHTFSAEKRWIMWITLCITGISRKIDTFFCGKTDLPIEAPDRLPGHSNIIFVQSV